ncbi:hypothetical protein [Thiospirillum jenense]
MLINIEIPLSYKKLMSALKYCQ